MTKNAQKAMVESTDIKASILAAFARIEEVPVSKTLIDEISDADWCDETVHNWKIEAGSKSVDEADDLDEADAEVADVA
jgi:hypothetical protein